MLPVRIGYALYNIPMHTFKETPRAGDLHKRARQVNHPKKTAFSSANTGFTSVAKQVNHPKKRLFFSIQGIIFQFCHPQEKRKTLEIKNCFFQFLGSKKYSTPQVYYSKSTLESSIHRTTIFSFFD